MTTTRSCSRKRTEVTQDTKDKNGVTVFRNKKRKIEEHGLTLPMDVYSLILEFLDPPAMHSLAASNKEILQHVTYELVIRNTILGGTKNAIQAMWKLIHKLGEQKIYKPSPMRMLAITSGARCECCKNDALPLHLGLLLCYRCSAERNHVYTRNQMISQPNRQIMLDFRVHGSMFCNPSKVAWGRLDTMKRPFRSVDQERNGPIITKMDIDKMIRDDITVDEYFDDFVPADRLADEKCSIQFFRVAVHADEELEKRQEAARNKKPANILLLETAIAKVQAQLQGLAKDFALDYTAKNIGRKGSVGFWVVVFTYPLSERILKVYLKNPSEARAAERARSIDRYYDEIIASGLVDFTCFSSNMHERPLQCKFRQLLEQSMDPGDMIMRSDFLRHFTVMQLIVNNDPKTVLLRMFWNQWSGAFNGMLQLPESLTNIMTSGIASHSTRGQNLKLRIIGIVKAALFPSKPSFVRDAWTWLELETLYDEATLLFDELWPLIESYDKVAHSFVTCANTTSHHDSNALWKQSKQRVVDQLWNDNVKDDFYNVRKLLLERNFTGLLKHHHEMATKSMILSSTT